MYFEGEGIDEILIELYPILLDSGVGNVGTRGDMREKLGVSFRMTNPRARISRSQDRGKPFSALGELLWYLAGLNTLEFIQEYIPQYKDDAEGGILFGAYGPRLKRMRGKVNQLNNVIKLLDENSSSKRAVIQLFDAEDIIVRHKEIPCTVALQFLVRDERLSLSVTMRSNDAYKGLPHDVFCFTMLQEMVASRLGLDVGQYIHFATSMHVYDGSIEAMRRYVHEGHQKTIQMPPMPHGDAFSHTTSLLKAENALRNAENIEAADFFTEPYWTDIVRLLQVFWLTKREDKDALEQLHKFGSKFHDEVYRTYLERRLRWRHNKNSK